jgi:hypothetical protein
MKIDRKNYELFFIDYYDGNLDQQKIDELLQFLASNADLEKEFYDFKNIQSFAGASEPFQNKNSLLKSVNDITEITTRNFDEFCIAYIENDLNEQNKAKFEMYLAENKAKQADFEKYKYTKLLPIIEAMPKKKSLLKTTGRVLYLRNAIRIAAAAAVISAAILFIRVNNSAPEVQIANNNPVSEVEEPKQTLQLAMVSGEGQEALADGNKMKQKQRKATDISNDKNKETNTEAESKPKEQKPKEKLKPAQKRGVYLVNNWNKKLNPAIPQEIRVENTSEDELEVLLAAAPTEESEELTLDKVRELLTDPKKLPDVSVWELADMGLRGFGRLTESEYSVKPVLDEEGNIKSVAFSKDRFTLFAPLRRNK